MPCPRSWALEFVAQEIESPRGTLLHNEQIRLPTAGFGVFLPRVNLIVFGGEHQSAEIGFHERPSNRLPAARRFSTARPTQNLDPFKGIFEALVVLRLESFAVCAEFQQRLIVLRPVRFLSWFHLEKKGYSANESKGRRWMPSASAKSLRPG